MARTTLYRVLDVGNLSSAIQEKYAERTDDFKFSPVKIEGRDGLLMYGQVRPDKVKWAADLARLSGQTVTVDQITPSALLLVRATEVDQTGQSPVWALSYGMGFHALRPDLVDGGFGQRVALRTADPIELQSLTRTIFGRRSMTQRASIPGGEGVRRYGFGDVGEIVTRVVARAELSGLTKSDDLVSIRGSDSLNLPLGRSQSTLIHDLDAVATLLEQPVKPELEVFEQLVPVKSPPELVEELEKGLVEALEQPDDSAISITWPSERVDEHGSPNSHRITGVGQGKPRDGVPSFDVLAELVRKRPAEQRLNFLRNAKIQLFEDTAATKGNAISSQVPMIRWLAYEHRIGAARFCLHDGGWFRLDQRHAERVEQQVGEVFQQPPPSALASAPNYEDGEHEGSYNARLATSIDGLLLDTRRITTTLHSRGGIEPCDVWGPDGEFIHSKRVHGSQDVSHLLAQMVVSADSLMYDEEGREALAEKVRSAGGTVTKEDIVLREAVLVVAQKRPLTAESLFTFSKVSLVQNVRSLTQRGVNVSIVAVLGG